MTSRELFLSLNSYEEFDQHRGKFRDLVWDDELNQHLEKIFPKVSPVNHEIHEDCLKKAKSITGYKA